MPGIPINYTASAHNFITEVMYSPLRCTGVGLSDGEVMERLWSYLRRFTRMTKEMRPSHRMDILAHALLFYGRHSKQRLREYNDYYCVLYHYNMCSISSSSTMEESNRNV